MLVFAAACAMAGCALFPGLTTEAEPVSTAAAEAQFVALLQKLVAERQREQKRADELQQKLDSMANIERRMRERQSKPK
ncbi:MAG: hypothetical protein FJY34_01755 [Betaproteobacteria bacterium]|nr:hypothetical protein [Betaproteobacteria bacterium]